MRPGAVWMVARRALVDNFRDRKTLVGFLLIPVISVLLLTVLRGEIQDEIADQSQVTHEVAVEGAPSAPALVSALEASNLRVISVADAQATVAARQTPVGLIVAPDAMASIERGGSGSVKVVTGELSLRGQFATRALQVALAAYADRVVADRIGSAGLPPETAEPLEIATLDARPPNQRESSGLAQFLPFLVLGQVIGLGQGISAELTTGQRDKRTLEAIVVTPLRRIEIVTGHWITAFLVAAAAGALTFAASVIAFTRGSGQGYSTDLPPNTLALIPVLAAFAATVTALMILAGIIARSSSQLGLLIGPLLLVTLGGLGLVQALSPSPGLVLSALPLAGPAITFWAVLNGSASGLAPLVATAAGLGWTALALFGAGRAFRSERALQRPTA